MTAMSGEARRVIALLPETLQNQIAAGEVVERPASVVKELVENSLDARASRVSVVIERGGQGLIRVEDDGVGIPAEELALAVTRHATSKISAPADLFAIHSFGFRGEALASVGSVSRLALASRAVGQEEAMALAVEGGRLGELGPVALAAGTRIEVRDLFFNLPARLKFLKNPGTESRRCRDILLRLCLAHLDAAFGLTLDGVQAFLVPARQTLPERLTHFWPPAVCQGLIPFDLRAPAGRVHGLAGSPSMAQPRAERLLFWVNGRPVQDRMLQSAVREAYSGRLLAREYPQMVLFLALDPAEVDVNVHPAKSEVRFRDEGAVFSLVRRAVREALDRAGPLESASARETAQAFGPGAEVAERPSLFSLAASDQEPGEGGLFPGPVSSPGPGAGSGPTSPKFSTYRAFLASQDQPGDDQSGIGPAAQVPDLAPRTLGRSLGVALAQAPGLSYLGQVAGTYLVLAAEGQGVVLVDQHAAHERVMFETIRQGRLAGQSRPLALPQDLALHPAEERVVRQFWADWPRLGFELGLEADGRLQVRATPAALAPGQALSVLREVLAGKTQSLEEIWISLACSQAVKAHTPLAPDEALALLEAWLPCADRDYCPHGRPTVVRLDQGDLEKMFKRKR